jgi:hypothetical protein
MCGGGFAIEGEQSLGREMVSTNQFENGAIYHMSYCARHRSRGDERKRTGHVALERAEGIT